jgi:hypothetical protein
MRLHPTACMLFHPKPSCRQEREQQQLQQQAAQPVRGLGTSAGGLKAAAAGRAPRTGAAFGGTSVAALRVVRCAVVVVTGTAAAQLPSLSELRCAITDVLPAKRRRARRPAHRRSRGRFSLTREHQHPPATHQALSITTCRWIRRAYSSPIHPFTRPKTAVKPSKPGRR